MALTQTYTAKPRKNGVLVFLCDVLAFASGASMILAVYHWLADIAPLFSRLGFS